MPSHDAVIKAYRAVETIKSLRVQADALIQALQASPDSDVGPKDEAGAEMYGMSDYQALRAAIECKMWCGKMLEGLGTPFPAELADKAPIA